MTTPIVFDVQGRHQFVYVLQFSSGTVKVGQTKSPESRLSQHAEEARRHGCTVVQSWVSPPHVGHGANEKALIKFCATRWAKATGSEYFAGASFEQTVEYAKSLPFRQLTAEEEARLRAAENERADIAVRALRNWPVAPRAASFLPSQLQLRMGANWYEKFAAGLNELQEQASDRGPNADDVAIMARRIFAGMSREEYEDAINHLVIGYWVDLMEEEREAEEVQTHLPIASIVRDELQGGAA